MAKEHISVVIPIYRCELTLDELYKRLVVALESINPVFEIIFVDDCSPAGDWDIIRRLAAKDSRVKALSFSRNFGQHHAITAGLHYSSGDFVVVMDGDLEDDPANIPQLYAKAQEGYDIVYADYIESGKPWLVTFFSVCYHKLFNFLANNVEEKGNARCVILRRIVVDNFNKLNDRKRHFGPLLHTLGFKDYKLALPIAKVNEHSTYTLIKKFNLAITSIVSHSTVLLRLGIFLGFAFAFSAFAYSLYVIARKLIGLPVELGWSSIMASIYFVGGLIMIVAGILGMYIESIIYEVKQIPLYVIREKLNLSDN